jgi:hypothetical protein
MPTPSADYELTRKYAPDLARQLDALDAVLKWPPLDQPVIQDATQDREPSGEEIEKGAEDA